jgi:hypothetical protein
MSPQIEAALIAAGVGVLTVITTAFTQYLGRRATSKQLDRTLAEQRKQLNRTLGEQRTRTFNERFATAADKLGSDKPPEVRLAGVYAMAGLADDWEDNRQTCVDVLCGYLRMPYEPDPGQGAPGRKPLAFRASRDEAPGPVRLAFRASREVRHTVIRVIAAHLQADVPEPRSWQGLNFDFTGVVFDGGDFHGAHFSGGRVIFDSARFAGLIIFADAHFSGGEISFDRAKFSGGGVDFGRAVFSRSVVVSFELAKFSGGRVSFRNAEFSGGTVIFSWAEFSRSVVVRFPRAKFSGGTVIFSLAKFSGGEVDFSSADDWSVPPAFPYWTGAPPPGVKLPSQPEATPPDGVPGTTDRPPPVGS